MPNTNGTGADGRRGPSIRRPLYLLVAVPLLTVIGLYGFVLYTTVGDAINLDRAPALINATSVPAAQFNINIQNERKASMVYLAAPNPNNRAALTAAQGATTQAFPAFEAKMNGAATKNAPTTAELAVIKQMLGSIQGLSQIRPAITARSIQPTEVFQAFSNVLAKNAIRADDFRAFGKACAPGYRFIEVDDQKLPSRRVDLVEVEVALAVAL